MENDVTRSIMALGLFALSSNFVAAQPVKIDADIPPYARSSGVSGNLSSIGSDTLNNLMTLWAEGFKKIYRAVNVQVEGKGSSTAPPALIAGTAQLGPMSRLMKSEEIDAFEKKYGYKPTAVRVAVDGLAIFVNKDNPLENLTLPQVDAIFSNTRKGGGGEDIVTWGQLGLEGEWFHIYDVLAPPGGPARRALRDVRLAVPASRPSPVPESPETLGSRSPCSTAAGTLQRPPNPIAP